MTVDVNKAANNSTCLLSMLLSMQMWVQNARMAGSGGGVP